MKAIWLFRFTSYSDCQGTRDRYTEDLRLLTLTLPCTEWEAISLLTETLTNQDVEFDANTIKSLNINLTNS
jgi:hypothetical protein